MQGADAVSGYYNPGKSKAVAHSAGHTITRGRGVEASLATRFESAPSSVLVIARTCSYFQASMYPLLL